MGKREVAEELAAIRKQAGSHATRLPVVTIDGEIAAIEWFSAWSLIDAVEDYFSSHGEQVATP